MYEYARMRPEVFTEQGQVMFLRIRDGIQDALKSSGAIRMQEAISFAGGGDAWVMLACVDRLVELGELREIPQCDVHGQHRIFVRADS